MTKKTVEMRQGETLQIGDIRVQLVEKSGRVARLNVYASPDVPVISPKEQAANNHAARMSALHCNDMEQDTHGKHTV